MRWLRGSRFACRLEAGYTLIELLVAIAILGVAGTTLVGGIGIMVKSSDYNRKQSVAGIEIRAFAEAVTAAAYSSCGTYSAAAVYTPPAGLGYTDTIVAVDYWNGAAFVAACGVDSGLQRITLSVSSPDGRDTETMRIAKRLHQTGESP